MYLYGWFPQQVTTECFVRACLLVVVGDSFFYVISDGIEFGGAGGEFWC